VLGWLSVLLDKLSFGVGLVELRCQVGDPCCLIS
jgi:hypothetical protein